MKVLEFLVCVSCFSDFLSGFIYNKSMLEAVAVVTSSAATSQTMNNEILYVRSDLSVGDTIALPGMPRCRVLRVYRTDETEGRHRRIVGVNLCCLDTMTFMSEVPCGELITHRGAENKN